MSSRPVPGWVAKGLADEMARAVGVAIISFLPEI